MINRVHIYWQDDPAPDLSYLEQDYVSETPADRRRYKAEDARRLAAYNRDEWNMLGCRVVAYETCPCCGQVHEVDSTSLWGIDSDSGDEYFRQVETDLLDELRAALTVPYDPAAFEHPRREDDNTDW